MIKNSKLIACLLALPLLSGNVHSLELQEHIVLNLNMDDISNNIIIDNSGNNRHGVIEGDLTQAQGVINKAVLFGDSGGKINVDMGGWKPDEFTVSFWLKPHSVSNYNQHIGAGWAQFAFHSNKVGSYFIGTSTGDRITPGLFQESARLKLNEWNHISVTLNTDNIMSVYVNGNFQIDKIVSEPQPWQHFSIGHSDLSKTVNGLVDDVRVYSVSLTAEDIAKLYSLETPDIPTEEQISVLWGISGELWQPDSRLPFVALAGYKEGKEPIPSQVRTVANVLDFGATNTAGSSLDTEAFLAAIEYASTLVSADNPGAIFIPAGEYELDQQLHLSQSGLIFRGEGRDLVTLKFTKGLINDDTALGKDKKRRKLIVMGGGINENGDLSSGLSWQQWNNSYSVALDHDNLPKRGDYSIKLASKISDTFLSHLIEQGYRVRIAQTMNYGEYSDTPQLAENLYGGPDFAVPGSNGGIWVSQQFIVRVSEDKQTLYLDRPLRFTPTNESRYGGVRIAVRDTSVTWESQVIGVENITIELPETDWLDHFGTEGQGGIDILSDNSWVKNVKLINADNGIEVNKATFNNTIENVILSATRVPRRSGPVEWRYDAYGHHGITLKGRDHLLNNFQLEVSFVHDVTMNNCHGCVVTRGKAELMNMDHHRQGIYDSVWTDLDLGSPLRMWQSTGNPSEGFNSAAFNTYWNIISDSPELAYWPEDGNNYPQWGYHKINIIGTDIVAIPEEGEGNRPYPYSPNNPHLEVIEQSQIWPANLYDAQVNAFRDGKLKGMEAPVLTYTR